MFTFQNRENCIIEKFFDLGNSKTVCKFYIFYNILGGF